MKKFYTADDIQADFKALGLDVELMREDQNEKMLFVNTFSNFLEINNVDIDSNIKEISTLCNSFMYHCMFPLCDFTGHQDSDIVLIAIKESENIKTILDEVDYAKVVFGFNSGYSDILLNHSSEKFKQYQAAVTSKVVDFIENYEEKPRSFIIVNFSLKYNLRFNKTQQQ